MRGASSGCPPGRRKTLSLYEARLVGSGEKVLVSVARVAVKMRIALFSLVGMASIGHTFCRQDRAPCQARRWTWLAPPRRIGWRAGVRRRGCGADAAPLAAMANHAGPAVRLGSSPHPPRAALFCRQHFCSSTFVASWTRGARHRPRLPGARKASLLLGSAATAGQPGPMRWLAAALARRGLLWANEAANAVEEAAAMSQTMRGADILVRTLE